MEEFIETQIKKEKEKLKAYLDLAGTLMVTLNKNGDIILINKKAQEVLGYQEGELIGKNWFKTCIPQNVRDKVFKTFNGLLQGKLDSYEFYINPILTKNGKERIVSWHNSILYDKEKNLVAILGSGEDITDLTLAEKKYRDLYEEAPIAYFSVGKNETIQQCNKAAERLLGYSKNELLKMKFSDLYATTKEDKQKTKNVFKKIFDGEDIIENELKMKKKNGESVWVSLSVKPILDKEGNIIESRSMVLNINKRKDVEDKLKNLTKKLEKLVDSRTKELRESEEKYRLISENANDLIAVFNKNFKHEYFNEEAHFKILGYKTEELIGKSIWDLIYPEDLSKIENINEIRDKGFIILDKEFKISLRLRHKDGHDVWVEAVNKRFTDRDGEFKLITIARDITNRKRAEQQLKKAEKEKSIILDNISEHIIFQDNNYNIIWVNKTAADSINKESKDLVGLKCYNLWHDREDFCKNCPVKKAIETGRESTGETTTPNGRIWMIKAFPVKNEEGEVFGAVEVASDITLRKQSEVKYREAYDQANLYKDLIAHDMNNILQNIKSSIELSTYYLKDPKNIEGLKELHKIVEEQVNRGANLVSNVHKLSELEKYKITLKKIDPIKILEERIEFVLNSFPKEEINIQKEYLSEKIKVYGSDLLMDIFENILINAIKHNDHPVKLIEIKMSKENFEDTKWIRFEFIDNGRGISGEDKEKIFKGLYKSKIGGGMGVGLSLVKKVIENHEGKIWVENRIKGDYSKGSNFIILLKEA